MQSKKFIGVLLSLFILIFPVAGNASNSVEKLEKHEGSVAEVVDLIKEERKDEALEALDNLHSAIVSARAELKGRSFTATAQKSLTDPFVPPVGTYRAHFTAKEGGTVKVLDMKGETLEYLFIHEGEGAASAVYRSDGSRIMIQFSSVYSPPGELVFEKLE